MKIYFKVFQCSKKKLYKLYICSNENEYLIHIKKLEDWKNKKLKKKEIGK